MYLLRYILSLVWYTKHERIWGTSYPLRKVLIILFRGEMSKRIRGRLRWPSAKQTVLCTRRAVLWEQNALPYGSWVMINLTAKAAINNCRAGRAAKGANPVIRTIKIRRIGYNYLCQFCVFYCLLGVFLPFQGVKSISCDKKSLSSEVVCAFGWGALFAFVKIMWGIR